MSVVDAPRRRGAGLRFLLRRFRRRPTMPPGERLYAIGDVHGRLDLLTRLIRRIEDEEATLPAAKTSLLLLGDIIDRGPQSRQVVELVMRSRRGVTPVVLKGNHEEIAVGAWLGDREALAGWLRHGGVQTLESYGVNTAELDLDDLALAQRVIHAAIPVSVIAWFRSLPLSYARGDYLFVHAGIRPGIPMERQEDSDMLWIRHDFLDYQGSHGPVVVHGHSISETVELRGNRIGIDTGAYRTGRLSAIRLYEDQQDVLSVEDEGEMLLETVVD
jgi:serine/threonine protein phosphatase 1